MASVQSESNIPQFPVVYILNLIVIHRINQSEQKQKVLKIDNIIVDFPTNH